MASYTIYFGDKPFYITPHMNERLYALTTWGGTIIVNQPNEGAIIQCIHDLDRTDAEAVIILTNKVDHYWSTFREQFKLVDAAGGVVTNKHNELLAIYRRNKWDLPKGKKDSGEDLAECAVREVKEETGLHHLDLGDLICTTFHTYHEKGSHVLKSTHWWHMYAKEGQKVTPQTEEDIEAIKWLKDDELSEIFANTYPAIKDVINLARQTK